MNLTTHETFHQHVDLIRNNVSNTRRVFPYTPQERSVCLYIADDEVLVLTNSPTVEMIGHYLLIDVRWCWSHCFVVVLNARWTIHRCALRIER
jgi:hypothetical protein